MMTITKVSFEDPLAKSYQEKQDIGEQVVDLPSYRMYATPVKRKVDADSDLPPNMYMLTGQFIAGLKRSGIGYRRLFTENELKEVVSKIQSGEDPEKLSKELDAGDRIESQYNDFIKNALSVPSVKALYPVKTTGVPTHMLFKVPFKTHMSYADNNGTRSESVWLESSNFQDFVRKYDAIISDALFIPRQTQIPVDELEEPITELWFNSTPYTTGNNDVDFAKLISSVIQVVNIYEQLNRTNGFPESILIEGKESERKLAIKRIWESERSLNPPCYYTTVETYNPSVST